MKIKNNFLRKTLKVIFFIPVLLYVVIGMSFVYMGNLFLKIGNYMTSNKFDN